MLWYRYFSFYVRWFNFLASGYFNGCGGYLCAHYARRLDPRFVRIFVIVVGFSMTTYFFIRG
jgi:uncharacterized membrane protein YfcA